MARNTETSYNDLKSLQSLIDSGDLETFEETQKIGYEKDGKKEKPEVAWTGIRVKSDSGLLGLFNGQMERKLDKDEKDVPSVWLAVENYVNSLRRQNARAAFLATLEGPGKILDSFSNKLGAMKGKDPAKIRAALEALMASMEEDESDEEEDETDES